MDSRPAMAIFELLDYIVNEVGIYCRASLGSHSTVSTLLSQGGLQNLGLNSSFSIGSPVTSFPAPPVPCFLFPS